MAKLCVQAATIFFLRTTPVTLGIIVFIPIPKTYFNPNNRNGFTRTLSWYDQVADNRGKIEKYKQRYQVMMKAWAGFTGVIGEHLVQEGFESYAAGRSKIHKKYGNLLRAYDYVFLSAIQPKPTE